MTRMTDVGVTEFLGNVPVLAAIPEDARRRLAEDVRTVHVPAGDWLFREGDAADCAYVVRGGRLQVVAGDTVLSEVKRGAVLGELALLREEARAASVRARRDSELLELRRERFEDLLREAPGFALALTRTLAGQLAAQRSPARLEPRPSTLAVVALDAAAPAAEVAGRLAAGLRRHGTLAKLPSVAAADLPAALERAEREHDRALLRAPGGDPADPWIDCCLREADRVVAVGSGRLDRRWLDRPAALHGCELLIAGPPPSDAELAALAPRQACVRRDREALLTAVDVLARRVAGRSLGLVLSGGGARAFAHLGVLEELLAAGLRFDRLAGVSLGAVVGGAVAMGHDVDAVYERFTAEFVRRNPSNDYTLPAISVLRGRKARRTLPEVFGDVRIEELATSFFCLSCDLVARRPVVHKTGLLHEAVYASLAIPGVFPPVVPGEGRLLVDGGVLDNLPVGMMARAREGPVVASDVTARDGRWGRTRRAGHERLARPLRRVLTGSEDPLPRLGETLFRTFTLGSADTAAAARAHADLVVVPRVDGIGLMEWKQLPRLREAGRRAAAAALEEAGDRIAAW